MITYLSITYRKMRKIFVTLIALLSFVAVNAQENLAAPYWFVNARGGASMPLESDLSKIIYTAPTASFSIGRMLTPQIGARLNVNRDFLSASQKEIVTPEATACADKFTIDLDAMFNLCTLFGKKDYYPMNVYMLAGLGKDHLGGGFMAEYNVLRNLSVAAETTLNSHHVWKAQLGLVFKFGCKKKAKVVEEPIPVVEEPAPAPAPVAAPAPAPAPEKKVVAPVKLRETIFYTIAKSDVDDESIVNKVVEWCNKNMDKDIVVSGYADKGTGNAKINKRLAEERATKVADMIRKKGIAADRIRVQSFGDTVQPFAENDLNRVTIIEDKK